ncbi:MAG TPA: ROK family protein [Casimicrobiaceae bacterium]|jgi:polyphosphate glucokinase
MVMKRTQGTKRAVKTLVIDVGGTHVKVIATGRREARRIDSGPKMTPGEMVRAVRELAADWQYDRISIGYPGPVVDGRPAREPWNLGPGWVRFDFEAAFGMPVRIVNDAAMQALGSYDGKKMLFLGLGTGLGSAMIQEGVLIPMELAHLPYRHGKTYEQYVGDAGMRKLGKSAWRKHVAQVVALFVAALEVDYVVIGGGNARRLKTLPPRVRLGSNANAFTGGFRLWTLTESKG